MCWPMVWPRPLEIGCVGIETLKLVLGAATAGAGAGAALAAAVVSLLASLVEVAAEVALPDFGVAATGVVAETELTDICAFHGVGHRSGGAVGTAVCAKPV